MSYEADLAAAKISGRPFRVAHGPSGSVVVYLTAEETAAAQAREAEQAPIMAAAAAQARLAKIDAASIRDLRAWVAAQPDAPKLLKDREAEAVAERQKLL